MKKIINLILTKYKKYIPTAILTAFALILIIVLALVNKNIINEKKNKSAESSATTTETDVTSYSSTDTTVSASNTQEETETTLDPSVSYTLTEYLNVYSDQFKDAYEDAETKGMNLSFEVRGNSLVFMYTYIDTIEDVSELKNQVDATLETSKASYTALLETIRVYVSNCESLILEYYNTNGNLITSATFK